MSMSLDLSKLEKVRDFGEGMLARCPACAETGQDGRGEHLRIYPDGKFGCCVHPGDSEHRKRIFALAGERGRRGITIRVVDAKGGAIQSGILGRLGRVFVSPAKAAKSPDATDGFGEVEPQTEVRTPRTGEMNSGQTSFEYSRTLRTPPSPLTRVAKETDNAEKQEREPKEFGDGVRNVRDGAQLPYQLADGTLVIPFDSPERYHWWRGGQCVGATLAELRAGAATKERMKNAITV
jgi:hypothetical protein